MEVTFDYSDDYGDTYTSSWEPGSQYTSGDHCVYVRNGSTEPHRVTVQDIIDALEEAAYESSYEARLENKVDEQLGNAKRWAHELIMDRWSYSSDDMDEFFSCHELRREVNEYANENGVPFGISEAETLIKVDSDGVECPACHRGTVYLKQEYRTELTNYLDQHGACHDWRTCNGYDCQRFREDPAKVAEVERLSNIQARPVATLDEDGKLVLTLDLLCDNDLCGLGDHSNGSGWTQQFVMWEPTPKLDALLTEPTVFDSVS